MTGAHPDYEQKFKLKTRIKLKTYKAFDVN